MKQVVAMFNREGNTAIGVFESNWNIKSQFFHGLLVAHLIGQEGKKGRCQTTSFMCVCFVACFTFFLY